MLNKCAIARTSFSESVSDGQNDGKRGPRGYDALGLILSVSVHPADEQDRDGAKRVLSPLKHRFWRLRKAWADSAYRGRLVEWTRRLRKRDRVDLEIVKKSKEARGFAVEPHRRVVERTFGWMGRSRRLSKDYEGTTSSSEAFIKLSMISLMVRRLVTKLAF
ncbi:MAG: transposase [Planctomycetota bacterium]|nr:transposase [Planctomycetota bacterium]